MSAFCLLSLVLAATPPFSEEIHAALEDVERIYAVPENLVRAVIAQESNFDPDALSAAGAIGLMQVMPFNAVKLGLDSAEELWDPRLNILAGVRLLAVLLSHYDGDLVAVLVAYNAGPRSRGNAIPENGETPGYVKGVLARLQRLNASSAR